MSEVKLKFFVFLTPIAREALAEELVQTVVEEGRCLRCASVQDDGMFVKMKAIGSDGETSFVVDVWLPAGSVLFVIGVEGMKKPGFRPTKAKTA